MALQYINHAPKVFYRCNERWGLKLKVQYKLCVAYTIYVSLQNLQVSNQSVAVTRFSYAFSSFKPIFIKLFPQQQLLISDTSQNVELEAQLHFPALFQAVADTSVFTSPDPRNYFAGDVRLQPQQCDYGQWDFGSRFCLGQHGNSPFSVSIRVVSSQSPCTFTAFKERVCCQQAEGFIVHL